MSYTLTTHFESSEFDCKSGEPTPLNFRKNIEHLANQLELMRSFCDLPIIISSGYRSIEQNKLVGGATKSQHLLGKAADFHVVGIHPSAIFLAFKFAMDNGVITPGGLKAYDHFVHYDTRGYFKTW